MVLFFYLFATLMVLSCLLVITSRNPVHAVLWLIFAFCNGSGLMILIGAEFIAMMLIIIYVGAVAVLFLFVIMMLDIKSTELKGSGSIGSGMVFTVFIALLLFADFVVVILLGTKIIVPTSETTFAISSELSNSHTIGRVLYTNFILPFQTAGLILFTAMIATISLALRLRPGVKRQKLEMQMKRNKDNSFELADVNCKGGLNNLNYDD